MLVSAAWLLWCATAAVVFSLELRTLRSPDPDRHSVTSSFREASRAWWAGENLYPSGVAGFLYFPQSAILYTPFTWGPPALGELLWRTAGLAAFTSGLWRMARVTSETGADSSAPNHGRVFLIASVLSLPLAASNLRNGQFNLPLAGLMLHAVADLRLGRWWWATLALCVMTALKPLGVVLVLLGIALYPRITWRLALGLMVVAVLPLAHPSPGYAISMYEGSMRTLVTASEVKLEHGQDLRGIGAALGIDVSWGVLTAIRIAAAPIMLAIASVAKRRWGEPVGALYTMTVAAIYLTLFNPRCEGLTYIVLSPAIGLLLAAPWLVPRAVRAGWALSGVGMTVAVSQSLTGGPNSWLRPAATIVLSCLMVWMIGDPAIPSTIECE